MLILKNYQKHALEKLIAYLEKARLIGPERAFNEIQDAPGYTRKYISLPELDDVPYVCLRLPTGGGKTLLAAHTVGKAASAYLNTDFPIVLWLVPTDVIRKQTLATLKDERHPNRQAIDYYFNGNVRVFDITEFAHIRPQDIGTTTCIFVATFAALRVTRTEGRKVYDHNEDLEPHFSHIHPSPMFERNEYGEVKFSFANLLAAHRPLVIIDEAHNHSSNLSVEVLHRLHPITIIEYTATPASNSNVLYRVTASELKAEEMIKLPIILGEHKSWEDSITFAIQTRNKLDIMARNEDQYIRPIALFQAESKEKDVTVEVIKNYLLEQENIPPEQIAVATGDQRELDGINLFAHDCPINYIITVQALKEGWDCSFAYVFCSAAKVHSGKDAEQLLGRVLRMPYAKRRRETGLNRAYAHLSVTSWSEALGKIHENLVNMGFEQVEAETSVRYDASLFPDYNSSEGIREEIVVYSNVEPDISCLNLLMQTETKTERTDAGYKTTFVVTRQNDIQELQKLADVVFIEEQDRQNLMVQISQKAGGQRILSLSEKGEIIAVPQLCLDFGDGHFEVADRESFLPDGWDLLQFAISLPAFTVNPEQHAYEIDVQGTKVTERMVMQESILNLSGAAPNWTEAQLISWFDRKLQQPDIPYNQLIEFVRRHVRYLIERQHVDFADLVRMRFVLEKVLREKIGKCREEAYRKGFQQAVFDAPRAVIVTPNATVVFREGMYPANAFYHGSFKFTKHFFPVVGAMNDEEVECAKVLEANPNIKTWVRNIERQPHFSFWLPTSTDKFYPDFVALLIDGRILAVEYKGEHLATGDDTREKDAIGRLWADQSGGHCLFHMATKRDDAGQDVYQQIASIVAV